MPEAAGAGVAGYAWEAAPDPVLGPGDWDSVDVLNPSVVRRAGRYFNFYSGFDGKTWHTGLAVSEYGVSWLKQGPVLSPGARSWEGDYIAANGHALDWDGWFWYWYQAGPKDGPSIGLARSRDGKSWVRNAGPVVGHGPRGSFDECATADPYVVRAGDLFYLFYLGQDRARRQRLGLARSRDGVRWEKLRANPVLELGGPGSFDEFGLGEPAVWPAGGWWWMLYTGRDRSENRRLGLARSRDGVRWEKLPAVLSGSRPWDARVVCDPTVMPMPEGRVRVWFGGGDRPSPDENLHGRIGVGVLRPLGATLEK